MNEPPITKPEETGGVALPQPCSPTKWTFATAKGFMPRSHTGAVHWVSDRQQAIAQALSWEASTLIEMDDRGRVIKRTAIPENDKV